MCLLIHHRTSSLHFFTWTLIGDTRPVPQYLTTQFAPPVLLPGNFISPSILSILQDRARRLPFYIACPNSTKKNDLILHNTLQNTARPTVLFYSIMTHIYQVIWDIDICTYIRIHTLHSLCSSHTVLQCCAQVYGMQEVFSTDFKWLKLKHTVLKYFFQRQHLSSFQSSNGQHGIGHMKFAEITHLSRNVRGWEFSRNSVFSSPSHFPTLGGGMKKEAKAGRREQLYCHVP